MNKLQERNYQLICEFVDKNVLADVTREVEYILNQDGDINAPYELGDLNNRDMDDTINVLTKRVEVLQQQNNSDLNYKIATLKRKIAEIEEERESDPYHSREYEVYNWYKVTPELAQMLKEYGEVTIEGEDIWGKTTFGELIVRDKVFNAICKELNII